MQLKLNLQLFAEEGGAAPADSGFATASADNPDSGGVAANGAGEQAAPAQEQPETFESLIGKGGKYKKEFDAKVQDAINRRFRNQQDLQGRIDQMNPLLTMLAQRYEVPPGENGELDYTALQQKILDDDSMYEDEAFKRGMDVKDFKHMRQLEIENDRLSRMAEATAREEQNRREFNQLVEQGEALRQIYPDFDLGVELQNPDVARLLHAGVPLQAVYEVVHKDEILAGGMQYAVQRTKEQVSRSIQSGMSRPAENGTSSQAAGDAGTVDPRKFTRQDFAEIRERVKRGERVTF